MNRMRWLVLCAAIFFCPLLGFADQDGKADNITIPAELKTAETLKQSSQQQWGQVLASGDYTAIAKAYADYMIENGRDRYGKVHSPVFVTAINRKTGESPELGPMFAFSVLAWPG